MGLRLVVKGFYRPVRLTSFRLKNTLGKKQNNKKQEKSGLQRILSLLCAYLRKEILAEGKQGGHDRGGVACGGEGACGCRAHGVDKGGDERSGMGHVEELPSRDVV